jgi:hypothetical protein
MVGRRRTTKQCVECSEKITGTKDYCALCHAKILEKLKNRRRKRSITSSGGGKTD